MDTQAFLWFITDDPKLSASSRDLIDRLIIAQGLAENLPTLSVDTQFDAYGVQRLW